MDAVCTARVHIALGVCMNAIRYAIVAVSENPSVVQALAVGRDVKFVDGRGVRGDRTQIGKLISACVRYVYRLVIWSKLDAVGRNEPIRNDLDNTRVGLEPVDLGADHRGWTEILPISILSARSWGKQVDLFTYEAVMSLLGEPKVASLWMLLDIIQGREVLAKEVCEDGSRYIGRWVYQYQL